jgi:hypothetical protein
MTSSRSWPVAGARACCCEGFVTVRSAIADPHGRRVELTDERWRHIVERHPEIESYGDLILRAVYDPDERMEGTVSNEEWYYARTSAPSNWLKVVVAYAEGRGHIVTAHARKSMP